MRPRLLISTVQATAVTPPHTRIPFLALPTLPPASSTPPRPNSRRLCRTLHITSPLHKKKSGKALEKSLNTSHNVSNASARSTAANDDPHDLSDLNAAVESTLARLKDDLAKLRQGGRLSPEVVEGLRVSIAASGNTVRLGELAQVMPRGGRTIVVMVGEEAHLKPITSSLLASPYSLNPTTSPTSPLELHLPIPPPTAESRTQALAAASKAGEMAAHMVRQARGQQQKKLRAMQVAKTVRADDLFKAGKKMEEVVEKANGEVKAVVEGARGALGG